MLIFRYIAKEILITLAALTGILILIFLSNEFMLLLKKAIDGSIPLLFVLKLILIEIPIFLTALIPLGFYIALLLVLGRMYTESEMVVLFASGYTNNKLLVQSLVIASIIAIFLWSVTLQFSPQLTLARARLIDATGVQVLIQSLAPGQFHSINDGNQVFYVEAMTQQHQRAQNIFLANAVVENHSLVQWNILWADEAHTMIDKKNKETYLILENGREYEGRAGKPNYQIAEFSQLKTKIPRPSFSVKGKSQIGVLKTVQLLPYLNSNLSKAAELQWRLAIGIMILPLTLVAVPLSRANARTGKFARLLPAIFIYFVYANLLFVGRDWITSGKIPVWLGLWWIHGLIMGIGVYLLWRNRNRFV